MPWCHHCKMEYVEGIRTCADCGAPLADHAPESARPRRMEYGGDPVETVLIHSTRDRVEADTVEALLRSQGILVSRVYGGVGQYMAIATGHSHGAIDLFIHPDRLEDAREVLDAMVDSPEQIPEAELQDESGIRTLRRLQAWLLILIFLFTAIVAASGQIAAFFRLLLDMLRQN